MTCGRGLFGTRKLRITPKALELPIGGSDHLLAILRQARLEDVGVVGVAMAVAGPQGWGAADTGFDSDAAIARYLERRDAEPSQPVAPKDVAFTQVGLPQFGKRCV